MAGTEGATHLTMRAARAYLGVTMHALGQLIDRGEVTGIKIATESGEERVQPSIASLDAWKAKQAEQQQDAAEQAA